MISITTTIEINENDSKMMDANVIQQAEQELFSFIRNEFSQTLMYYPRWILHQSFLQNLIILEFRMSKYCQFVSLMP